MNITHIKYSKARSEIKEGDILLFRGKGIVSFLISAYTGGPHTHAAIAHWDGDTLYCVEFREFKGGRIVSLRGQVDQSHNNIDVFRPAICVSYDELINGEIEQKEYCYTEEKANKVSHEIVMWTGQPYSYKNIFKMFKRYIPLVRFFSGNTKDDHVSDAHVCSTAVATAVRKHFVDLVPFMADSMVSPAALARSPLLRYLFTIEKD